MANKDFIARHKSWQEYAKKEIKAGRKPTKFKSWKTPTKTEDVYFRGLRKEAPESQLATAGLTADEIARLQGKSTKYKRSKR